MRDAIQVKVCGIARPEDAAALDALAVGDRGIDYLGFNFWPGSKRHVTPEHAAAMITTLRHAIPVGVFVDHSAEEIADIAARTGIRMIQLHGSEPADLPARLAERIAPALPVIRALPHTRLADWGGLRADWNARPHPPEFFLVDTQAGATFGGSGAAFDWSLLEAASLPRPVFLAGGIGPENLEAAVRTARPFAVDLNSKVESAPGVKDVEAVRRCLKRLDGLRA